MRTAPTGPANGRGEISRAAEAPLIASTSCELTMSTESTVAITWISFRKPFGKSGRIGRSIIRAFRVAFSEALPSRLKKPPGILPAAYIFSSTSTVSGKKSVPSRASVRPTAVASTSVSPLRTTTAPSACFARRPDENVTRPVPTSASTVTSAPVTAAMSTLCPLCDADALAPTHCRGARARCADPSPLASTPAFSGGGRAP